MKRERQNQKEAPSENSEKKKDGQTIRGALNKRGKVQYVCACEPAANLSGGGTLPR